MVGDPASAAGLAATGRTAAGLAATGRTSAGLAAVYNIGIAGGSAAGGITLQSAGAGALPWAALPLVTAALVAAALATAAVAPGRITTCIA